jgi:GNAT superfamily N-acetyltransferase
MSLFIRLAAEPDLEEVGRITVDAYTSGPGAGTPGYVATLRDAQSRFDEALLYVAELDGVVVGSVTLARTGSKHAEIARPGELEVRYLSVEPTVWGQGIAKALMGKARDIAQHDHCVLVLDAITHNTKVHEMYTNLGFVRMPARDFSPVPNVDLMAYVDAASPYYKSGVHESGIS